MPGIVVGFDGSSHSRQALDWAVRHAGLEHVSLTALAVHEVMMSNWTGNPVVYPEDTPEVEKARQAAQDAVNEAIGQLGDGPRPESVTVRALVGNPAQALIEASADADLVVVGSRGVGGFAGIATGSVTAKVVNHSACPVVVVRHK
jgi:nucleotide-binding universal stress UspA family protein